MGHLMFFLAEKVFAFGNTMWNSLTLSVGDIIGLDTSNTPAWIQAILDFFNIGNLESVLSPILTLTLAELIIGAIGFTLTYTLIKWAVGIVTGS
jgi:hypothetical protein